MSNNRKLLLALTFVSILICSPVFADTTETETSPGDAVIDAVDQLIADTMDQQTQADLIYFQQKDDCDSDIALRQQAIEEAQGALAEANIAYGMSYAALQADNHEIEELNNIISFTQYQLSDLADKRSTEQEIFNQNVAEHDQMLSNIDYALDLISQFKNYGEINQFLQLGAQVNSMFKSAAKTRNTALLIPVVASLMQIKQPSTVSADQIQKLVDLFNTLKEKTQASKNDLVQAETDAINLYNQFVDSLNVQLDFYGARLTVVTAHQAEMQASLAQEDAIINEAQSKFDRNTNILESTQTLCDAFVQAYQTETQNRQDHIVLLQQLKQILQSAISEYSYGEFASLIEKFGLKVEDVEKLKNAKYSPSSSLLQKGSSGLVKQNQRNKNNLRKI